MGSPATVTIVDNDGERFYNSHNKSIFKKNGV